MREIFFNSFKEKILRGEVDSHIIASGIPMSNEFLDTYDTDDISIEQYRNLEDFNRFSKGNGAKEFEKTKFQYDTFGVDYQNYYDDDLSEKPIFVNSDNSAKFLKVYGSEMLYDKSTYVKNKIDRYLSSDDININSGFYYVTKKSHLNWIAKRVNDDYNFNNRIVVVLGDDIGTANEISGTAFESVIGSNPNKPFQGIFDLNGHAVNNLNLLCKKNSNGIIGYLGTDGIVRDGVVLNPRFTGLNRISLEKIKDDCSDVVCGTLVGTNYGTVENIVTSGTMRIMDGFCPEVYVAGNKSEYQAGMNTYEENNYTNAFFPSKFCINSVYNVIPYVGYFCEGADSYFNDIGSPFIDITESDEITNWLKHTSASVNTQIGMDFRNTRNGSGVYTIVMQYNQDHYLEGKLSNNSHCDLNSVELTRVIPDPYTPTSGHGYSWDINRQMNGATPFLFRPDVIWFGYWGKQSTGNTYLADVYRKEKGLLTGFYYLRPLITMSNDQVLPDKLMKNTVKSIGKFIDFEGNDRYSGLDTELDYMYEYSDYAANLTHQLRDQLMLYYDGDYVYEGHSHGHVTTHQKMNPYSRIAYYLSPIVGNNFGTIHNIDCRHAIEESEHTFVGFIGNVCGKANCGKIYNCEVNLDIYANSASNDDDLEYRDYRDTTNFVPDYIAINSGYNNMLNFFGYNYDYYQCSAGLAENELKEYSAHSADCVKVSKHYYQFHDLTFSGVQESMLSDFIFNMDGCNGERGGTSNFRLDNNEEAYQIGYRIPSDIRKAKMKFKVSHDDEVLDDFSIQIMCQRHWGAPDVKARPCRASYKFYNPYHKFYSDNIHEAFNHLGDSDLLNEEGWVEHMDLNYLGDAAKCVMESDIWTGLTEKYRKADNSEYVPTASDVLNYCSAFHGSLGTTIDNAKKFCRNMMDAKTAIGYDMLGNQELDVSYRYPDYNEMFYFGSSNNGLTLVIPSATGPNDNTFNWVITNRTSIPYYMGPCPRDYGNTGPNAFNPEVRPCGAGDVVNTSASNPAGFCSVQAFGLWDLHGDPAENDYKLFDDNRNSSRPSIMRTMLTITPRSGNELAEKLIKIILNENDYINGILSVNPTADVSKAKYELKKIYIPFANRTQHGAYQSSSFEGDVTVSGIYLEDTGKYPDYSTDLTEVYQTTDDSIGNLDLMYIDMAISIPVENYTSERGHEEEYGDLQRIRYETYPIIAQIPLSRVRIPISAIDCHSSVQEAEEDVVNETLTEYLPDKQTVLVRGVSYYHLTPAYDLSENTDLPIRYKLRSIYNIGGIAGMINHAESYIQTENGMAGIGPNWAECGSISECKINITQRTNQFVQDLQSLMEVDRPGTPLGEVDARTMGITNKIAGVAAVYEYRQNDMGTSSINAYGRADVSTDGLMRIRCQKYNFTNISIGGEENYYGINNYPPGHPGYYDLSRYLKRRGNRVIFSPFIEWCNISNMLDTTNFFGYKESYTSNQRYLAYHSSNFPVDGNPMLYTAWMEAYGNRIEDGQSIPKPLASQMDMSMLSSAYPFPNPAWSGTGDDHNYDGKLTSQAYAETMNRFGSTSAENDFNRYGEGYGWHCYPRIGWHKNYDYIPSFLMNCTDVYVYGTKYWDKMYLSMSPMANAPCSDYNDVFLQMFSGNPNFVNRKLSKPVLHAKVQVHFGEGERLWRTNYEDLISRNYAKHILEIYEGRADQYRDKYFTWDYETSGMRRDLLQFDIIYKKPKGHSRGLWIHQLGFYDEYEVLRYAMKGGDYGKNDGACLHLGYLPSDKAVVEILNYDGFGVSALPHTDPNHPDINNRFEEGHAISGYGFNGMLLVDTSTNDLICYIDTENDHDFDLGCWVAPMSEKIKVNDSAYGLLTEIVAENSPKVEQDPNDNTDVEEVTLVENVYYVDNTPQNIEQTTVTIQENVYYVDNTPKSI